MSEEIKCCVTQCEKPLDQSYWDAQYKSNTTSWDLGEVSPPIKAYFDKVKNKNAAVLIPGCGNTHEADYLLQQGFTNITVIDIAPTLVNILKNKFEGNTNITIILGDFFKHQGSYDFIIEQTFFCALPPTMRQNYVFKMHNLLKPQGQLVGLLFNREFDSSPPFGGSKSDYELLVKNAFTFLNIDVCENSITPRANTELWIEFKKNEEVIANLYTFEGITCSGCKDEILSKLLVTEDILNASINSSYTELLIISNNEIEISKLQDVFSYDQKYKILKIK